MEIMYKHIWSKHNYNVTLSSTQVIQLHASALGIGHLQAVHNLSINYTIYVAFTRVAGGGWKKKKTNLKYLGGMTLKIFRKKLKKKNCVVFGGGGGVTGGDEISS